MTVLATARTMYALPAGATAEDVRARWRTYAAELGFNPASRGLDPGERIRQLDLADEPADAYVNQGRWVADCPRCGGGIAADPEIADGCCLDCGTVRPITFPPAKDQAKATALLVARDPVERNWRPDLGEPIDDLKVENLKEALPFATPELAQNDAAIDERIRTFRP